MILDEKSNFFTRLLHLGDIKKDLIRNILRNGRVMVKLELEN